MHREIDVNLVSLPPDALDVWAELLRAHFPRLQLSERIRSSERLIDVVVTGARILDSGELELYTQTEPGEIVTLRVGAREWAWR